MTIRPKSLHVTSWGCQMNVHDSERMAALLAPLGYGPAAAPADADLVVLNTCHIRERATEKLFSELGRLRLLQQASAADGRRMMLAVAGCVAQAEGAEITRRAPFVDIVVGPQAYHRLPELIARASRAAGVALDTDFAPEQKFDQLPPPVATGPTAFLTVQEGCDKFCAFCVVPYTRGAEASRPTRAILADARHLATQGVRELTLLGQNVNAWHGDGLHGAPSTFARLLADLAAHVPEIVRLRYTTSHPRDMDAALIAAHRDIPALMPFLHLPVQSGSDRVLRAMNRRHTADDYRRLVDRLRDARPDLALSSDFIVGHPGETDADFQATLDLVAAVTFAQAYSFAYSARPGTPAASLPGQLPDAVRSERLQVLQALLREQQAAFNARTVGVETSILVTGPGRHPGQLAGRTPWMQAVHAASGVAHAPGHLLPVRITAAHTNSLTATPVLTQERACA